MSPTITTHPQAATKVTADHLRRDAYLYVRQSTLRQVLHNTTSTQRQYDLRGRAIALGWTAEQLIVIDTDQGQSGASAVDRDGFQHLVAEVGMGHAGIVLGLEVSRLARNNTDWHRLLEICALSGTLILDEDGLYDPCSSNDRLLLGLKGTMSEAELHLLKARLRGGVLYMPGRGGLIGRLPDGLVYHPWGRVVLDPDAGVQQAVRHLLATFAATGSAFAVVKAFTTQQLSFPRRLAAGPNKGELVWGPLQHSRVLQVLHNPRYAGAFFYGRHTHRIGPGGKPTIHLLPREQWTVLITDAHPGYLSFAEFEANQARLAELAAARGTDRRASPICQRIPGVTVDAAVARLLVDTLTPLAIQAALTVAEELVDRADQADRIRAAAVERARYQADLARRRYLAVDPQNRLVADTLEADWNTALRELAHATDTYQHATQATTGQLTAAQRQRITQLATDFPALWNDPATPQRERKRLIRLLISDVILTSTAQITAHVRLRGGQDHSLHLPIPLAAWQLRQTPPEVVSAIDQLLDDHTDAQIATILSSRGLVSRTGRPPRRPSPTTTTKTTAASTTGGAV